MSVFAIKHQNANGVAAWNHKEPQYFTVRVHEKYHMKGTYSALNL